MVPIVPMTILLFFLASVGPFLIHSLEIISSFMPFSFGSLLKHYHPPSLSCYHCIIYNLWHATIALYIYIYSFFYDNIIKDQKYFKFLNFFFGYREYICENLHILFLWFFCFFLCFCNYQALTNEKGIHLKIKATKGKLCYPCLSI